MNSKAIRAPTHGATKGEEMGAQLAVAALALFAFGNAWATHPALPKTPPSTWKQAGYKQLRFGMGPGDVEDALRQGGALETFEPISWLEPRGDTLQGVLLRPSVEVAGRDVSIGVHFVNNRLYEVSLSERFEKGQSASRGREWIDAATLLLTAKYGKPTKCEWGACAWINGDFQIKTFAGMEILYSSVELASEALSAFVRHNEEWRRKRGLPVNGL